MLVFNPGKNLLYSQIFFLMTLVHKALLFAFLGLATGMALTLYVHKNGIHIFIHTKKKKKVQAWKNMSDKHDEQKRAGKQSHVLHRTLLGLKGLVCVCKPHAVNEEVHCGVDR